MHEVQCSLFIEPVYVEHLYMKGGFMVLKKGNVQYFCPLFVEGNRQND